MEESIVRDVEEKITLTLSERELFVIKWSLELMARNYQKGGILRYDIDSVRNKLATVAYHHMSQN